MAASLISSSGAHLSRQLLCRQAAAYLSFSTKAVIPTADNRYPSSHKQNRNALLVPRQHPIKVPTQGMFWEPDRKGGYDTKVNKAPKEILKEGMQMIRPEFKKWREEWEEKLRCEAPFHYLEDGDFDIVWQFEGEKALKHWTVTADSDHSEGKSTAQFGISKTNKALFTGVINNEPPKDGIIKKAGYANIRSPRQMKSFQRPMPYNWEEYTHLIMRIRGDGRQYMVGLGMDGYFDITWNDLYHFVLFTRGGPYWQFVKMPLSKFFRTSKGRIQDKQEAVQKDKVAFLGITVGDDNPGPFHLEIDYIGVQYDGNWEEEFAYEQYECSSAIAGV